MFSINYVKECNGAMESTAGVNKLNYCVFSKITAQHSSATLGVKSDGLEIRKPGV